jgi:hypothetical protein
VDKWQGLDSVDEFMSQLPNYDQDIEAQRKEAEEAGEVGLATPSYLHRHRISNVQNACLLGQEVCLPL